MDLRDENAEVAAPDTAGSAEKSIECAGCQKRFPGDYFIFNELIYCPHCADGLRAGMASDKGGSFDVPRALLAGFAAAVAFAGVMYGIYTATDTIFFYLLIISGVAIGKAVHWGSSWRGGPTYQVIAVALTYVSLCFAFVPEIVDGMNQELDFEPVPPGHIALSEMAPDESEDPDLVRAVLEGGTPWSDGASIHHEELAGILGRDTTSFTDENGEEVTMALSELAASDEPYEAPDALTIWRIASQESLRMPVYLAQENEWIIVLFMVGALWFGWKTPARTRAEILGPFSPSHPAAGSIDV